MRCDVWSSLMSKEWEEAASGRRKTQGHAEVTDSFGNIELISPGGTKCFADAAALLEIQWGRGGEDLCRQQGVSSGDKRQP